MKAATAQRSVPFFDYPQVFLSREAAFVETFRQVGRRGAFIMQKDLEAFEQHLARFLQSAHAVGVANATDGLMLGLRAAGLRPGDEVILCSHTMIATAAAVHFAGGVPVPVEVGADHLIDPDAVEAAITPRTRFLMPTQLNGRTCDMARLGAIAERHHLQIVEDAAQALGSRFRGRCAGTFGTAAAISFYPAKVLGCLGDGGAVLTQDAHLRERLLLLRDHGRGPDGECADWGINSRLDNLQAAFLDLQLPDYPTVVARRREIAARYQRNLGSLAELKLPPAPDSDPDHFDIFQNYEIEAEDRDRLRTHLKARGVGVLIQWGGYAVHQCRALGFTQELPRTDALFRRLLMLPMNMSLSDEDVDWVSEAIADFYAA